MSRGRISTIATRLNEQAEHVAGALMGKPNLRHSNKRELRWGNKGGL